MHVYPFAALLAADVLHRVGQRSKTALGVLVMLLAAVGGHNVRAMLTRVLFGGSPKS